MRIDIPPPTFSRVVPPLVLALAIWMLIYQIMHPETACQSAEVEAYMPGGPPPQVVAEICAEAKAAKKAK